MTLPQSRFAAIADIHGNADALRAVLTDIDGQGVDTWLNLGDHFSGPLDAGGTGALLRAQPHLAIRGNHDRYLLEQNPAEMGPSDRVALEALTPADLEWLRQLPPTAHYGADVFLCHGTPDSDGTYWLEQVRKDGFIGMADRGAIEAAAQGIAASLILCGHTHVQRSVRLADGRMIVNPGSVGCPGYDDDLPRYHEMQTGTPAACYAILEHTTFGWDVTFRQVPYESTRMAALALSYGRDEWARALQTGWVQSSGQGKGRDHEASSDHFTS